MTEEKINWSKRIIQEIPESTDILMYQVSRSLFDKMAVKEECFRQMGSDLVYEEWDAKEFFGDMAPSVKTWVRRMFDSQPLLNLQLMFAKLDQDKYLPIGDDGTKMTHALLGLVATNEGGQKFAGPIEQLCQMAFQLGFLPPATIPMPYCTVYLFDKGLDAEAHNTLEWLKYKPGNLLRQDVRAKYAFRDFAPGDIYATLGTKPIFADTDPVDTQAC